MIPSQHLFSLTIVFFYEYARGRYALNGRVTCSPDSPILYSHFLYHVPPARVLVCFLSVLHVSLTCTSMDCRLVSRYLFVSRFSFRLVDSSTYVSRLCLSPSVLSIRLSACYFWTMTRYRLISLLQTICTCISLSIIYTGWRWDCSPSSIYFATTLKV